MHAQLAVCKPFMEATKALANLHKVAQVHLSLLSLDNLISAGSKCDFGAIYDCSECSGESAHLHRFPCAFITVPKSHALAQMTICVPFIRAAKALASLHQQIQ